MADLTPATPIKLSSTKLEVLSNAVQNLITDLEQQSQPLFDAMEIWQKNYEAKPKQSVKNFPFANASNIVVPLAKIMVDSRVGSLWSAIHGAGNQVWQTSTQNEEYEDQAKQIQRYINWQADGNDFSFAPASYDWLMEQTILGSSVLAGNWRQQQSHVYKKTSRGVVPVAVNWNRGPILEHVPRRQMLWDTSYPSIGESPAVVRQFAKSWAEIATMSNNSDGWFKDAVEECRDAPGMFGPGEQLRKSEDELDLRGRAPNAYELHDIREVTLSWPNIAALDIRGADLKLPGDMKVSTPLVDIVVTIHRQTGKILRLASQPYFYPGKPFFDSFFHKRIGRGFSVGMVKIVESLQAAITTVFNQGIDAQTRANSVWAHTNIAELRDKPINPASIVWDPTMKGIEALNFPGSDFSNIQLIQLIQATAERLSGQSDPAFGRETRLGGHSAPATTTLALLERGNVLAAPDRRLLAESLGRAGEFIATLNQQFETDDSGKITRVLGDIDGAKAEEIIFPTDPIPTNFKFTIKGLSGHDNPDAEMQKQILVHQQTQAYWGDVFKINESMTSLMANTPPEFQPVLLESYTQGLKGLTKTYKRILDAADIDDVENFILTVNDSSSPLAQHLASFADRARQSAGPVQNAEQPGPVAQAGVTAGNGAAGPPGIAG